MSHPERYIDSIRVRLAAAEGLAEHHKRLADSHEHQAQVAEAEAELFRQQLGEIATSNTIEGGANGTI